MEMDSQSLGMLTNVIDQIWLHGYIWTIMSTSISGLTFYIKLNGTGDASSISWMPVAASIKRTTPLNSKLSVISGSYATINECLPT